MEAYNNGFPNYNLFDFQDQPLPKLRNRVDSCPPSPSCGPAISSDFIAPPDTSFAESSLFFNEKLPLLLPSCQEDIKGEGEEGEVESDTTNNLIKLSIGKAKKKKNRKEEKGETAAVDGTEKNTASLEGEDEEAKKTLRAEKNRKFAQESRERKRKYVQDIEAEVRYLRKVVEYYKSRLSKYELIEKQRNMFGYELVTTVSEMHKEILKNKLIETNPTFFMETLEKKIDQAMEDRRKAVEQLTRAIAEIVMPASARISLWITENNIDVYDAKKLSQFFGPDITFEHVKDISEYTKKMFPDKKQYNEMHLFMAASARRVKVLVRQLINCQKQAQIEIFKNVKFIKKNLLAKYDLRHAEAYARVVPALRRRPELSDAAIYQLNDDDFRIEDTSLAEEETKASKQN